MIPPRRRFLQKIATASLLLPFSGQIAGLALAGEEIAGIKAVLPGRLSPGQTVGIISPAGAIYESEPYEIAAEVIEAMGLKVKLGTHVRDRYGHLAGSDFDRAEELNDMFKDSSVDAIICLRGGSGAARILERIDYGLIKKNPKILIGYSDITALLLAVYAKTGLVTFHGPVATSSWSTFTYHYFRNLLFEGMDVTYQNPPKAEDELVQTENRIRTIYPGKGEGVLVGGNLTVLAGLIGTGYLPSWKNKILFLEDVGEKIYRIDRMMAQLKLAGVFEQLNGFIFGKCSRCGPGNGYGSLTFDEVMDDYIKPLKIPAYSGAMIGHVEDKFTVPLGVKAEMDADKGTFRLLEPAVI